MLRKLSGFLVAIFAVASFSFKEYKTEYAIIKGSSQHETATIVLSRIESGEKKEVATYVVGKDKRYAFMVTIPEEGFYVLGAAKTEVPLYIKAGSEFIINLDVKNFSMEQMADEESKVLSNWVQLTDTLAYYKNFMRGIVSYKDFFPFYEKFIPKMEAFRNNVKTANKTFDYLMKHYISLTIEDAATHFLLTPRVEHPAPADIPAFYSEFSRGDNFKTAAALRVPQGLEALNRHVIYQMVKLANTGKVKNRDDAFKQVYNRIANDTLKAYVIANEIKRFKAVDDLYYAFMEPYQDIVSRVPEIKNRIEAFENANRSYERGAQGISFSYEDGDGKTISSEDLRGKFVYVDLWATWCGPCKIEIPYLQKLEKEYHNKDIHFVSISLDKPKDKEKWKDFVKDKELSGIQLFAGDAFESKIATYYKVSAIPRFMLFDKSGKIISIDAPRPSDPKLKALLDKELSQ